MFVLVDWAGGQYEVDFLKKCWFGDGSFFFSKMILLLVSGLGLENCAFADIRKKCEVENDAEGLKTYFATDFEIIFWNFRQISFGGRGV